MHNAAPRRGGRIAFQMTITTISRNRCFGGIQGTYSHESIETGCAMRFGVFLPPQAETSRVPLLYWLSGLTCTEENFIVKAGAPTHRRVARHLRSSSPIPAPRGLNIPGEGASYDFGLGAGFYVDATEAPWSRGYRMYSYVAKELAGIVAAELPVDPSRAGIFGHSMGGHGALTICAQESTFVQVGLGLRAYLLAHAMSLGRKGPRELPRR